MGMEIESATGSTSDTAVPGESLETRPGILLIGSPSVGKRTILSRLLSTEIPDTHDLSTGVLCQGWTIETKYYSADVSIWTAHLGEYFSFDSLPNSSNLTALVMVFDMTEESSLRALQKWVAKMDITKFEILLCVGNKADLLPLHQAHTAYKRRLQRRNESSSDPHPEYSNYGINSEEGSGLLCDHDEESSIIEIRNASLEWCTENNIEYIEACASNADFDKCLSVDGDVQGVERIFGAISAHMWPGMILKSGNKIPAPILLEKEESSDEESEYEIEYETLSHGSDEPWHDVTNIGPASTEIEDEIEFSDFVEASGASSSTSPRAETSSKEISENKTHDENVNGHDGDHESNVDDDDDEEEEEEEEREYGLDEMQRVVSEIGNVRGNLRLMPDFQRREMAAKIALQMASMFGGISDDEEET